MTRTNKEIVLEHFAEVLNGKNLGRLDDLFSKAFISHGATYVGSGIKMSDIGGKKLMVVGTMPGSSADGKVMAGDQIIWVSDGKDSWDTFEELSGSSWGSGIAGSSFTIRVLRGGATREFQLTRGFIQGMTWNFAEFEEGLRYWLTKLCPDYKVTVDHILAEGDLVSILSTSKGTFTNFNRQAVWNSFELVRLKDGKIVEYWGVEDTVNQQKQLGYRTEPPVVEKQP